MAEKLVFTDDSLTTLVDETKAYVDGVASGKSDVGHTHSYAGSSSVGGAATSANKLNTNAGSGTQPVYFANGIPVATTYTLAKSVPSNAVFTDTNTKVTQTVTTSNASYPLLLAPSGQTATTTTTSYFDSGVTLNPSTNTIVANISGSSTSCTGNAATATSATTASKLGSSTVGGAAKPIYLSSGTATACSSTVGGANQPVYMSSGTITACNTMCNLTEAQTVSGVKTFSNGIKIGSATLAYDATDGALKITFS